MAAVAVLEQIIEQPNPPGFNSETFEEWVQRYAKYHDHSYDMEYCRKWTRFYYLNYLRSGGLPNFMMR